MADPAAVLGDLLAEGEELEQLVAPLAAERWSIPTPAPGWTVAHQIAHLAWTDERALLAATDPGAFAEDAAQALTSPETFVDDGAQRLVDELPPAALLDRWRTGRATLHRALAGRPAGVRIPWYGPPMSVASMATARLMETWAHGQDVADALGVRREPTARLRHVVRIGVRARDYAYTVHGLVPPAEEFRVELTAPDGDLWAYGPEDAAQRVTGAALDFCLLATQRAHRSDLALYAEGPDAAHWLDIAQAFAGPPGKGRAPAVVEGAGRGSTDGAGAAL
ncbi:MULTISPECIES: TIGR03084 family metal-binding protein [Streptomyces]|uniref:TIGR03084 family protein n=2 Tax=Streptomyces TaxID=1883 RepID=A0A3S5IL82_9ACTN|nr:MULTISPECIES: TIGR03084 family metal-binding protein [Streptomyces]KNE83248.1 wyosine base formation domain-containing protein [Streptomyces fradiae]OFA53731.1 TIGR03084 family protein [Streptomyces fradiae]PQM20797.1 TIGR03084 family protein [Streptomyces xinghaiensis]RKM95887.1 TIGR03084 family protein [Streptomyces xinghaiensis]RNC70867.1 TIGR03084 family protein [Streptomyces xinghaiensis]